MNSNTQQHCRPLRGVSPLRVSGDRAGAIDAMARPNDPSLFEQPPLHLYNAMRLALMHPTCMQCLAGCRLGMPHHCHHQHVSLCGSTLPRFHSPLVIKKIWPAVKITADVKPPVMLSTMTTVHTEGVCLDATAEAVTHTLTLNERPTVMLWSHLVMQSCQEPNKHARRAALSASHSLNASFNTPCCNQVTCSAAA